MNAELSNNIAGQETSSADRNFAINDETFCRRINRLKELHEFLYQEGVPINPLNTDGLGMGRSERPLFSAHWQGAER